MKGEVILPFVATWDGVKIRPFVGQVIEIPNGVDWVQAGFVRPLADEPPAAKPRKTKKADD